MNTYFYRVLLANGRTRYGMLRLMVERDLSAKVWLERHYEAVVLQLYRLPYWLASLIGAGGTIGQKLPPIELSGLLRDLAVMTKAGVPIIESLKAISEETDTSQKRIASTARLLISALDAGAPISEAFNRHPNIFPESVRNLMEIGEESGTVDKMLLEAAEHIERMTALSRNMRQALIYPAFVFATMLGAALFWIYYVIPNLAGLFLQMRVKLPKITLMVLEMSKWMEGHANTSLYIFLGVIFLFWALLKLSRGTRKLTFGIAHKLPIFKTLVTASGMAFITEHLAIMIASGVDIMRSLGVLERALTDEYYKERIKNVRTAVERGELLASAMRQVGGFPPMALRMIAVGEETGSLDKQLKQLAQEYRMRLAHLIASLSEIIKPVIILLAGLFFVLMIVALLLPIYDLVRQASLMNMG
ncbi:type II secretion system F family protein [Undibacterium fentianense]|uniref:Type II secretion system F family protein n=1 Tax=Undibacterium fentianense TaxID=2828728 RepID=A0A941E921_9BURK|nr:type II secretion system F family protein [Undibacterium fentianense]MBR7800858.1 type II secretion system F family protein [Undibacterium fentianense]